MSAIHSGRKRGARTYGVVEEEGFSTSCCRRDEGKQNGLMLMQYNKVKGVWVGGFVSVKYIVPLKASLFIRGFHITYRAFSRNTPDSYNYCVASPLFTDWIAGLDTSQ
jgi:hypothetical protein